MLHERGGIVAIHNAVIARYAPTLIGGWPGLAQAVVYIILGIVWLLPLRRFLIWMETGRTSPPDEIDPK